MKINEIWHELENDLSFAEGLLVRRYAGSVLPDIFVALKVPEKIRCIAASISKELKISVDTFSNLRDINVTLTQDQTNQNKQILLLQLLSTQHQDIFSVLCEDLMISIENVTTEGELISELFNRFEKWKTLFEISASQGLTEEEQRGLFGELFLLRKLLHDNIHTSIILSSWVGCENQIRDFQYNTWSIEVKTTHGNNHQRLHINSERQLDSSILQHLFLFHLSLETRQKSGETLNDIVNSIKILLQTDIRALNKFNAKLIEGRYFVHHAKNYNDTGYVIRQESFYRVHEQFPRIEERDIRNGVGDVNYSIIVSQASDYLQSELEVFQNLNFDE